MGITDLFHVMTRFISLALSLPDPASHFPKPHPLKEERGSRYRNSRPPQTTLPALPPTEKRPAGTEEVVERGAAVARERIRRKTSLKGGRIEGDL
jgi:hypothetical protein